MIHYDLQKEKNWRSKVFETIIKLKSDLIARDGWT